jgi:DNA polymerase-3 subunit gamma/tau
MTTIYRKYRPQTFSSLVGQEYIVQTITNELKLNKLAQAYLFSGPRGTGKTTLARLLAKAVNCEKRKEGEFEPCDTCTSCQEITAGRNVDVIEIDAASQTGVDNVRENIIENAQFKPTRSKYKVFIVDEVHMLSTSAFNALLKTLEEPPAHVLFILATTNHLPA